MRLNFKFSKLNIILLLCAGKVEIKDELYQNHLNAIDAHTICAGEGTTQDKDAVAFFKSNA